VCAPADPTSKFQFIVSYFIKIHIGLTFLVLAYQGCPGKEAIKWVSKCFRMILNSFSSDDTYILICICVYDVCTVFQTVSHLIFCTDDLQWTTHTSYR